MRYRIAYPDFKSGISFIDGRATSRSSSQYRKGYLPFNHFEIHSLSMKNIARQKINQITKTKLLLARTHQALG